MTMREIIPSFTPQATIETALGGLCVLIILVFWWYMKVTKQQNFENQKMALGQNTENQRTLVRLMTESENRTERLIRVLDDQAKVLQKLSVTNEQLAGSVITHIEQVSHMMNKMNELMVAMQYRPCLICDRELAESIRVIITEHYLNLAKTAIVKDKNRPD